MRFTHLLPSLFFASSFAAPAPQAGTSTASAATSICTGNTATTRSQWCDYDINTDFYDEGPDTGVIREYWLNVVNTTAAPDGVERIVLSFNGTIPGPLIEADWGDTLVIHVTNSMADNGTTVHWHGLRQNYTNPNDGVPSITQCAIAPGDSMTYTFKATQYGTTWYHSHFSVQAWDGIAGPLVINGPASADYDIDLGPVFLSDWSHATADALYLKSQTSGPPQLDNGLINGTNTYTLSDGTIVGSRFQTTFEAGKKYRIRLINGAIDSQFKFMIDNHTMTVISHDLVPINPFETTTLDISMGQRYDIIVEADQDAGDFWMRAIALSACSNNANPTNINGIVRYDSSSTADPTTTAYTYTNLCVDMPTTDLVPVVSKTVGDDIEEEELTVGLVASGNLFKWKLLETTMVVEWGNPTLLEIYNGDTNWTASESVISLDGVDEWYYFVIETALGVAHPIHLHGHDFYVLAQEAGATFSDSVTLQTDNPPRRDVAILPASGYLVIAFKTDNPGAWLMHCHIGWHTTGGLALQFVERVSEIPAIISGDALEDVCTPWNSYATASGLVEDDSGV